MGRNLLMFDGDTGDPVVTTARSDPVVTTARSLDVSRETRHFLIFKCKPLIQLAKETNSKLW